MEGKGKAGDSGTKVGLDPPAAHQKRLSTVPQGKVTTGQNKANKASSECARFSKESWSAATDFEHPRKKRNKNEKGKNFFFLKKKEENRRKIKE